MEKDRRKEAENAMAESRKRIAQNLGGVKHKIAVMSGKGGVGKTTIAVNLAAFLAKDNKVSILDADIDCPNVNKFLDIRERFSAKGGKIIPVKKFGMKVVSFASLQEREDQPIIWRGPMVSKALMQILGQVEWGELDYLIVDLPPGTGDVPLTIMQILKPDGMIIVTTPQDVAIIDAKKSANMAKKLDIPVLGIVENMAGEIFGSGGGERAAKDLGVYFLGRLELDARISRSTETGRPFVLEKFEITGKFKRIAERISQNFREVSTKYAKG